MSSDYGYAFGDDQVARDRLALLHQLFSPASEALLGWVRERYGPCPLAVDLGCGTGQTTRLLQETTGAERTVGVDASGNALQEAQQRADAGLEFLEHDLRVDALPVTGADLVYARLLLTHLPDPAARLQAWSGHLAAGGVLAVEEIAAVDTDHPVLEQHLRVVADLLEVTGRDLYAGSQLPETVMPLTTALDTTATVVAEAPTAARLFRMNLPGLQRSAGILEDGGQLGTRVTGLDAPLEQVVCHGEAGTVTWTLRHLVLERPGDDGTAHQ